MKKFYSLLLMMMAAVFGVNAATLTINFNIDNADAVTLSVENVAKEIKTGLNTLEVEDWSQIKIAPKSGYSILSVVDQEGKPAQNTYGTFVLWAYEYMNGYTYTVKTVNLAESRDAKFNLIINGSPESIEVSFPGTSSTVECTEGLQQIAYSTENEATLKVRCYKMLYRITVDNETVASAFTEALVTLKPGCTVVIDVNFPDTDVTIDVVFGKGAEDCLTDGILNSDYQPVELTNGKIVAKCGSSFNFEIKDEYKVDEITLCGKTINQTYYHFYKFTVVENGALVINAHELGDLNFTVNVNLPEAIKLYQGYIYEDLPYTLSEGINNLTIPEPAFGSPMVSYEVTSGYEIESFTDADGNDYRNDQTIDITEGMELTIVLIPEKLDNKAVLFIANLQAARMFNLFYGANRTEIGNLKEGYNVFDFSLAYNPFMITYNPFSTENGGLYLNDEYIKSNYEATGYFTGLELENNDVLKAFITETPEKCEVTFNIAEDAEATVKRDIIVEVTDPSAGFTCFAGTAVNVTGNELEVTVNETKLSADSEGVFSFTVEADTNVEINKAGNSISSIDADAADTDAPVYNLQGIKVATRATTGQLPAGIYILDGSKIAVK